MCSWILWREFFTVFWCLIEEIISRLIDNSCSPKGLVLSDNIKQRKAAYPHSDSLFGPSNSPKLKDIRYAMKQNGEKQTNIICLIISALLSNNTRSAALAQKNISNSQQTLTRLRQPYITGRTVTYCESSGTAAPGTSPWRYSSSVSHFTSLVLMFHTPLRLE